MQRTGHLSEATEAAGPEAANQPTPGWLDLCAPSSGGSKDITTTTTDRSGAEARRRPVGGGAGGGGRMSIRPVSAQVSASGPPPSFELDLAGNGVYSVEMATDPTLFDQKADHGSRNADTFFSSYQASGLLTALPHQLLEAAWRRPNKRSRLYYRAMSARAADDLSNFHITTPDESAARAPFITVTGASGAGGGSDVREVVHPSGARFDVVDGDIAGEDYADPTGGAMVPLIDTAARLAERLAPNFTLAEFVGKVAEQYRYARVSVELVNVLQQIAEKQVLNGTAVSLRQRRHWGSRWIGTEEEP
jgi:hypothetical protein